MFNIREFGATGDGVTFDDDAFQRAFAAVAALSTASSPASDPLGNFTRVTDPVGPILFIPLGTYRLRQTLNIVRQMIIQGEGGVGGGAGSSRLFFDERDENGNPIPVTGIVIHLPRTVPGFDPSVPAGRGDGTVLRDIAIAGNNPSPTAACVPPGPLLTDGSVDLSVPLDDQSGHGIILFGRAYIEQCTVSNFAIDGVHIATDPIGIKNANAWEVRSALLYNNGRHGLYAQGEDSNAGLGIGIDANFNCGAGIFDRSFLGNTYVACHAQGNHHGGGYNTIAANAISRTVFVGCYAEADNQAELGPGSLVLGGVLAAEVATKVAVLDITGIRNIPLRSLVIQAVRTIASLSPTNPGLNDPQVISVEDTVVFVDAELGSLRLQMPRIAPPNTDLTGQQFVIKRIDNTTNSVLMRATDALVDGFEPNVDIKIEPRSVLTLIVDGSAYQILSINKLPVFPDPNAASGGPTLR